MKIKRSIAIILLLGPLVMFSPACSILDAITKPPVVNTAVIRSELDQLEVFIAGTYQGFTTIITRSEMGNMHGLIIREIENLLNVATDSNGSPELLDGIGILRETVDRHCRERQSMEVPWSKQHAMNKTEIVEKLMNSLRKML